MPPCPPASPGSAAVSGAVSPSDIPLSTTTTPDGQPSQRGATHRRFRQRTEATRERDVFRHLLAWEETYKPRALRRPAFGDGGAINDPTSTRMCPDTALAAFAQLITLRLRARRCLISLIATDDEFVLADMTKTAALQHDSLAADSRDQSWIGTCNFPRKHGINHEAVEEWRKARRMRQVPEDEDHYYVEELSQHWSLVKDARHHARRQQLPLLRNGPWIRSCISVPLRGAQGSVLGAITVLDERPSYGISADEMNFLEDISDTTVEHLNATIARCQRQRGERLIQALGMFNNGKASLRDWWLGQDDARILGTGRHAEKGAMTERQARVDAEFGVQRRAGASGLSPGQDDSTVSPSRHGPSHYKSTARQQVQTIHSNSTIESTVPASQAEQLKLSVEPGQALPDKRNDPDDLALSSSGAYARASNLLREATGVDGVVFANASTVIGSLRQHINDDAESNSVSANAQDDTDSNTRRSDVESSDSSSAAESSNLCDVLAFANRNRSTLVGYRAETQPFPLQEHQLQRLINRYPAGAIFHFDRQGQSFASSDDGTDASSNEEWGTERKRRSRDARILSKAINGVRTVALYPLWDDSIDRYRSCMFVWSTHSDRYFDREEQLTYLKAFGHSLVAQLSRLESLETDKAKSTFMSSISHETRSPLHGIMAGVEFLQESELSLFQEEMVHAISMAGRTLLDTMDHILDYSKISKHSQGQMTARKGAKHAGRLRPGSPKLRIDEIMPSTDLARLTEEVVETTVAAFRPHRHQAPSSPQSPRNTANSSTPASAIPDHASEVSVLLNVDFRKNWVVKVPPGAWTRILTNLLGNALKYTQKGQISVRLEVGSPSSRGSFQTAPIQLIIKDTGIGISEAFQAHGLYMPFKQEDCHAQGTGLGLSIVKQLARDIGANLSLKSKRGRGTRVTLGFSAEFANEENVKDSAFTADSMPEGLVVDQFHLLSPTAQGMPRDLPTENHVGDSVLEIAEEWLHCNALQGPDITRVNGNSVCAMTEEQLNFLETKSPGLLEDLLDRAAKDHSHLLILGRSIHSLSFDQRSISRSITPVFVHQPIGPRKLLRAIASDRSSSSQFASLRSPTSALQGDPIRRALEESTSTFLPQTPRTIDSKLSPPSQPSPLESSDGDESTQPSQSARSSADKISTLTESNDSASTAPTSAMSSSPASCGDTTHDGDECILLVEDNEVNMKVSDEDISKSISDS